MSKLGLYLHFFKISSRFIRQQVWMSLTSVLSIALVVVVLIGFLSMAKGFEKAMTNSGADAIAIALSGNAQTEITSDVSQEHVDIVQSLVNQLFGESTVISPELVIVVSSNLEGLDSKMNINLRGIDGRAVHLHEGFELVAGRMFTPGTAELIVGDNLQRRVPGLALGKEVRLGGVDWRVVGTFTLQGNLFESEVWGSVKTVQSDFDRQNQFQSIRIPAPDEDTLFNLALALAEERRLDMIVQTEKEYFVQQSSSTVGLIKYIGWPLAIILSIGAFCGTFNSLKMAVDARQHELKILNLIGFERSVPFLMLMYEATIFSAIGALLGTLMSWWLFDGLLASTYGSSFNTVSFALAVDGATSLQAFGLALAIGLFSGLIPAWSGTRASQYRTGNK